jgi:hypothetical protein
VDNIKMGLRVIGYGCKNGIDLAQDMDQWRFGEYGSEISVFIKCWEVSV